MGSGRRQRLVEGQGGNDALDFNGSNAAEKIDVSANGSRVRLFRDVAAITLDFDGIEGLNVGHARQRRHRHASNDLTGTDLKTRTSTSRRSTAPATARPTR